MSNPVVIDSWFNCYRQGWGEEIVPEAYAHPAKFSRNLIRRIYEHMREEGWLPEGSTVLDPFGGVALGALDCMRLGCHHISIELEPRFVALGEQNIALWNSRYADKLPKWGTAVILQGDSRQLLTWNFAGGKVEAICSSPPFADVQAFHDKTFSDKWGPKQSRTTECMGYGSSPANLGNMKDTGFEAAVGSPPFCSSTTQGLPRERTRDTSDPKQHGAAGPDYIVPTSPGQLASMREGDITAAIASPPYAQSVNADSHGIDWAKAGPWREGRNRGEDTQHEATLRAQLNYGASPGNLGAMREGSADAVCSSPPYAETMSDPHDGIKWRQAKTEGGSENHQKRGKSICGEYGKTPGQLGNLPPGSLEAVADNCITSPPFCDAEPFKDKSFRPNQSEQYTKQPYEKRGFLDPDYEENAKHRSLSSFRNPTDTFWAASRQILSQLYLCIKPGGHAVFVCGDFIRAGKRVPFSQQWATLCESVGFKPLHWHTAHKTERYGTQLNTEGGEEVDEVSRVSFFRRLASRRGGETISSEEILCFLRP